MYLYNVKTLTEILITILFDDNDGLDYSKHTYTYTHTDTFRRDMSAANIICFPSLAQHTQINYLFIANFTLVKCNRWIAF